MSWPAAPRSSRRAISRTRLGSDSIMVYLLVETNLVIGQNNFRGSRRSLICKPFCARMSAMPSKPPEDVPFVEAKADTPQHERPHQSPSHARPTAVAGEEGI